MHGCGDFLRSALRQPALRTAWSGVGAFYTAAHEAFVVPPTDPIDVARAQQEVFGVGQTPESIRNVQELLGFSPTAQAFQLKESLRGGGREEENASMYHPSGQAAVEQVYKALQPPMSRTEPGLGGVAAMIAAVNDSMPTWRRPGTASAFSSVDVEAGMAGQDSASGQLSALLRAVQPTRDATTADGAPSRLVVDITDAVRRYDERIKSIYSKILRGATQPLDGQSRCDAAPLDAAAEVNSLAQLLQQLVESVEPLRNLCQRCEAAFEDSGSGKNANDSPASFGLVQSSDIVSVRTLLAHMRGRAAQTLESVSKAMEALSTVATTLRSQAADEVNR